MLFAGVRERRPHQALIRPGKRLAAMMRDVQANALPPRMTMRPPRHCRKRRRELDFVGALDRCPLSGWAASPDGRCADAQIGPERHMTTGAIHATLADDCAAALAARLAIRRRDHVGHTAGLAPGFAQANLAILPQSFAK